ncbi:uncharacterized protein LOC131937062 [Physella acuta]|uniref:uncharacterized protein LOC131937062 n=1 Tax=Physella acuta TaxID=109671 RepID=UPI0027DCC1DA|nr:uncharacterized protein LOC131937062 [Physella acuta]
MASHLLWLLCLTVVTAMVSGHTGHHSYEITTDKILRFLHSLSGYTSSEKQVTEERERNFLHPHTLLEVFFIPVDVKLFNPTPTLYFEEFINKVSHRRHILTVTEDKTGLIHVTPYNISANITFHRNGTLDLDAVYRLGPSDLESHPNCVAIYEEVDTNIFLGTWPDCYTSLDLHNPKFTNLWTCHFAAFLVSHADAKEGANPAPFKGSTAKIKLLPYMMNGRNHFDTSCGPTPPERIVEWPSE